jgi:ABC-2 type transport system ATP-binding protein
MQEAFYSLIFEARKVGKTIFMSSHVLSEVERVCDRIALLRSGRLALLAPVEQVRKLADRRVRVTFSRDIPSKIPADYEIVRVSPREWHLRVRGPLGPLVNALTGLPVEDLQAEDPRLEDVLIRYYREEP